LYEQKQTQAAAQTNRGIASKTVSAEVTIKQTGPGEMVINKKERDQVARR